MRPSSSSSPRADELVAAAELDADACSRLAALRVEDVGRDSSSARIFAPGPDARERSPPRRRFASRPSRTTSSPPTYSRSTRCGPARDPAGDEVVGAAELEPVRAPDRDVGALARLERADVVAAEHPGAASRSEPERIPRRHRLRAAAPARDEQRLLDLEAQVTALVRRRAVDAEADAHARVDEVAHAARRPRPGAGWRSGSARRRCLSRANVATSASDRWTQCAHQTSPAIQPSWSRYSTGGSRTAPGSTPPLRPSRPGACAATARACARVRPTRPSAPSSPRTASRARRPGRSRRPSASPASRSVSARIASIVLDQASGGRPPSRVPEVHRAARGDEAHAELARRAISASTSPAPAREHVVVVEDGRAARQRELGEPGAGRGVLASASIRAQTG